MRLVPYVCKSEVPSRLWPETTGFFDDFLNDFPFSGLLSRTRDHWMPTVDILEKDGNLVLRAELPGVDEKEIDLKLEGNVLTLKGERKMEKDEKKANYHRVESYQGAFSRSFELPDMIDRDKIKAEYKSGILTVTIPRKPEVQPREIPVSVQ
jgi:HSP20 family protein